MSGNEVDIDWKALGVPDWNSTDDRVYLGGIEYVGDDEDYEEYEDASDEPDYSFEKSGRLGSLMIDLKTDSWCYVCNKRDNPATLKKVSLLNGGHLCICEDCRKKIDDMFLSRGAHAADLRCILNDAINVDDFREDYMESPVWATFKPQNRKKREKVDLSEKYISVGRTCLPADKYYLGIVYGFEEIKGQKPGIQKRKLKMVLVLNSRTGGRQYPLFILIEKTVAYDPDYPFKTEDLEYTLYKGFFNSLYTDNIKHARQFYVVIEMYRRDWEQWHEACENQK